MHDLLLPQPVSVEPTPGSFTLDQATTISHDAPTATVASRFATELRAATALPLSITDNATIAFHTDETLPAEGYRITVTPNGIDIAVADLGGAESKFIDAHRFHVLSVGRHDRHRQARDAHIEVTHR